MLSFAQADKAQQRQLGEVIARQTGHMTGLIDDLLDVSRVTRGLVAIDKQPVNMQDVIADAMEQVRPLIEAHGHSFESRMPPCGAMVLGDKKRLIQVVANLVNNAVKYTPNGGRSLLTLAEHDGRVVLAVSDNGIGMS
ncbi:sensor histidine kinase, partial [Halorubrum sp. Atlit-28R]